MVSWTSAQIYSLQILDTGQLIPGVNILLGDAFEYSVLRRRAHTVMRKCSF